MGIVPYDYSSNDNLTNWVEYIIGVAIGLFILIGFMWLVVSVKPRQRTYNVTCTNPDATYEGITWAGDRTLSLPDGRLIILPENNTCVYEEIKQ